jgi:hypothetical protein
MGGRYVAQHEAEQSSVAVQVAQQVVLWFLICDICSCMIWQNDKLAASAFTTHISLALAGEAPGVA